MLQAERKASRKPEGRYEMSACNWAVVGVRIEDAEVAPIEVFERYEEARDSMLCKIHALVDESGFTSYIDDCGQDVDVYLGMGRTAITVAPLPGNGTSSRVLLGQPGR